MSLPAKLDEEDIKYLNSLEENRNKKEGMQRYHFVSDPLTHSNSHRN